MSICDIDFVNMSIGNTESNPYYPILTRDEIQAILDSVDGDTNAAIKKAAISASFYVISIPNREKIGDIEIWNEYSRNYLEALKSIIEDNTYLMPKGMMPYAGGIHNEDFNKANSNPNRHVGNLVDVVRKTRRV